MAGSLKVASGYIVQATFRRVIVFTTLKLVLLLLNPLQTSAQSRADLPGQSR